MSKTLATRSMLLHFVRKENIIWNLRGKSAATTARIRPSSSCPSNSTHLTLATADIRPSMTDRVLQSSQPSLVFTWSSQLLQHFQVCPYCRLYGKYFETTGKVSASLLQRVETSGFQNKTWVLNVLNVYLKSTKFTRIYHLRDYLSKCSSRRAYPWTLLDNFVDQDISWLRGLLTSQKKKSSGSGFFSTITPVYI